MIKFLIKGLLRDRSRSLFPVLMVTAGVAITVLLHAWMNGAFNDLFETAALFDAGHIKITTRAYSEEEDQMPNDLALVELTKTLENLRNEYSGYFWVPRTKFGGLLDIPDENGETRAQGPVLGIGIDLFSPDTPEKSILNLEKALEAGKMPSKTGEILISAEFAETLGIGIGDRATLISSTVMGAMSVYNLKIAGTVNFGIMAMDRGAIIADISDVQYILDMPDSSGQILGFKKDMVYYDEEAKKLREIFNIKYSDPEDEFSMVASALSDKTIIGQYIQMADNMGAIISLIFISAMGIVLWNAGLLNGIRRYGEIGIRIALGESKNMLYVRMIIESVCIGIAGSVLGTIIGLIAGYYLQVYGIDVSSMMQKSSMLMKNVIRAKINFSCFYVGFIPGVVASVMGTIFAGVGIYRRDTSRLFKELEL